MKHQYWFAACQWVAQDRGGHYVTTITVTSHAPITTHSSFAMLGYRYHSVYGHFCSEVYFMVVPGDVK